MRVLVAAFKVHGGPLQTAGVPDVLGCYSGVAEVCRPAETPFGVIV
jgi:hypothetical protein